MIEPEVIGFLIEGENIVVANPCTIPIDMMKKALRKRRKKDEVVAIGGLLIKGIKLNKRSPAYKKAKGAINRLR